MIVEPILFILVVLLLVLVTLCKPPMKKSFFYSSWLGHEVKCLLVYL